MDVHMQVAYSYTIKLNQGSIPCLYAYTNEHEETPRRDYLRDFLVLPVSPRRKNANAYVIKIFYVWFFARWASRIQKSIVASLDRA